MEKTKENPKRPGRPYRINSVEGLDRRINEYFEHQDKHDKPYTIQGLALFLGISVDTFYNIGKREEFSETIKLARLRIENSYAEKLVTQGTNTTGIIFALKNNYKWVDKQEIKQDITSDVTVSIEDYFKDKEQDA